MWKYWLGNMHETEQHPITSVLALLNGPVEVADHDDNRVLRQPLRPGRSERGLRGKGAREEDKRRQNIKGRVNMVYTKSDEKEQDPRTAHRY